MAVMLGLAALIAGMEKLGYWPDWATAERHRTVPVQKAPPAADADAKTD